MIIQTPFQTKHLRIHGDNIVECERAVSLFRDALGRDAKISQPKLSLTCPSYTICSPNFSVNFELFPGFRRWNQDILSIVTAQGGMLREAADIVITEVIDGVKEVPLLAFEFCAALPAGNQAWQRNGRGYSFGSARIPYFFLADLGGYELGGDRVRKAERTPNPAVPFSYISFGLQSGRIITPVYSVNIGASNTTQSRFAAFDGYKDFHQYLLSLLKDEPTIAQLALDNLYKKTMGLVNILANSTRHGKIPGEEWQAIYNGLKSGVTLSSYLINRARIPWSKTAYITGLTATFRQLVTVASQHATGLTASKLPACLIAANDRSKFADAISVIHKDLSEPFLSWLKNPTKPLALCWVMGFKPRGDDARPDRGLPPFVRMLVGSDTEILTIVYGPLAGGHWTLLEDNPTRLLRDNGLWQSIMACSDGLLVDAQDRRNNNKDTVLAYTSKHWYENYKIPADNSIFIDPIPTSYGENDVDTALHLVLAKIGENLFFEGSCNPPGGDWSGISIICPITQNILRYLTLPRVSSTQAKRPDHVFQYINDPKTLIVIESKEFLKQVENDIGPRLVRYLTDLFKVPASVEYTHSNDSWTHSVEKVDTEFNYVTVAAGIFKDEVTALSDLIRTKTDIAIGLKFEPNIVILYVASQTNRGTVMIEDLLELTRNNVLVEIRVI